MRGSPDAPSPAAAYSRIRARNFSHLAKARASTEPAPGKLVILRRLPRLLVLALLVTAQLWATLASAAPRLRAPVRSASYDWDDNAVFMNTLVHLVSKRGGQPRSITTSEYALEKHRIGHTGALADYALDATPNTGSFRDTSDANPGQFARDVASTVALAGWQGPSWEAFARSLSTAGSARRTSIITAREHSNRSLYAGLKVLHRLGLIRYLPRVKNLYGVGHPSLAIDERALVGSSAERKVIVQRSLLDELQRDFARTGRPQVWRYTDDDWHNYETTVQGLQRDVAAKRWPGVTLSIHFTSAHDPAHAPESTELR